MPQLVTVSYGRYSHFFVDLSSVVCRIAKPILLLIHYSRIFFCARESVCSSNNQATLFPGSLSTKKWVPLQRGVDVATREASRTEGIGEIRLFEGMLAEGREMRHVAGKSVCDCFCGRRFGGLQE